MEKYQAQPIDYNCNEKLTHKHIMIQKPAVPKSQHAVHNRTQR
uniref:Uncharacterized protein n=1 Tax=Rhizophora mucronata TaxID=61149 RepID=A0A2P2N3M2_RHIMU